MPLQLSRRALGAGLLASIPLPAAACADPAGPRLPDHADFWAGLPLPFTPAQAWGRLDAATQAEIGAGVIGMVLADYVSGNGHAEADLFLNGALRDAACDVSCSLLGRLHSRVDQLLPDLFGPEGDHPAWALVGGLAR